PLAALELLHRLPGDHHVRLDGGVLDVGRGDEVPDGRLHLGEAVRGRGPDIDLELAALGNDVGPRAARDLADVDGHTGPAAVEGVEIADDAGRFEDRVTTLL